VETKVMQQVPEDLDQTSVLRLKTESWLMLTWDGDLWSFVPLNVAARRILGVGESGLSNSLSEVSVRLSSKP
jgi:hypothetical protein